MKTTLNWIKAPSGMLLAKTDPDAVFVDETGRVTYTIQSTGNGFFTAGRTGSDGIMVSLGDRFTTVDEAEATALADWESVSDQVIDFFGEEEEDTGDLALGKDIPPNS